MMGHFFGPGGKGRPDRLGFLRKYRVQANENASIAANAVVFQMARYKDIVAGDKEVLAWFLCLAKNYSSRIAGRKEVGGMRRVGS